MSLIHRDRPDFLLCSGNQRIGIEVTESIPRDLARFDALAERDNRDILIELPEFGWNAPQRTLTELRDLLRQSGNGRLQSDGWAGDQPEKEWSLLVRNTIHKKLETAKNVEFRKYDSNWLLIYDNLPFMGLDLERSVKYLQAGVGDIWTMEPHFEKIFIESGQTIIEIDANHSTQNSLVDLWQMG